MSQIRVTLTPLRNTCVLYIVSPGLTNLGAVAELMRAHGELAHIALIDTKQDGNTIRVQFAIPDPPKVSVASAILAHHRATGGSHVEAMVNKYNRADLAKITPELLDLARWGQKLCGAG